MKVGIEIRRSIEIPLPYAEVENLYTDLETTIRRFPKLKKLKKLGEMAYLWEMSTIGSRIANIAHDVSYAAKYTLDLKKGKLSWVPVPQHGNATIKGEFQIEKKGPQKTLLSFHVSGDLRDVPVPLMYRLVAPPFIQGKFTHLVDVFLENTREALEAGQSASAASRRRA